LPNRAVFQLAIYFAGAVQDLQATLAESGEPLIRTMRPESVIGPNRLPPYHPDHIPSLSAYELWQSQKDSTLSRNEYLDHWEASVPRTGTGRQVDAIIAPMTPYTAPPHGDSR
jgi:amidase